MYSYNGDNKFRIVRRQHSHTGWYAGRVLKYGKSFGVNFSNYPDNAVEYLCYKDAKADFDALEKEYPLEAPDHYKLDQPEDDEDTWKEWEEEIDVIRSI